MHNKDTQLYKSEIDAIRRELDKLPKGHLTAQRHYYYETIGTVQKGITKDRPKVKQLARKAYLIRRLGHLEWNYSLVKKQSARYKTEDPKEIIRELPSFYQMLPVNYFFHPIVDESNNNEFFSNMNHNEGLIYLTNSGIHVRSKSERTIADTLDQNNIPYRYEAALVLGGENRYPDFTVYRPSDGKLFLWEHLGLIKNEGYRQKAVEKLTLYARYGFFPFDNLICTYEQDIQNPARIQAIIEMFLSR
jgi:hypothetical protein